MSVNTKSPLRLVGGVNQSGNLNDGNLNMTQGGMRAYTVFSGGLLTLGSGTASGVAGPLSVPGTGHAVFVSGPGRLNNFTAAQLISGIQTLFYDSNIAALSGVSAGIAASGLTILSIIPANTIGSYGSLLNMGPLTQNVGAPYYNGLAVSCASGAAGFTVTFTQSQENYVGP